jgi:hypothetical protein
MMDFKVYTETAYLESLDGCKDGSGGTKSHHCDVRDLLPPRSCAGLVVEHRGVYVAQWDANRARVSGLVYDRFLHLPGK